MKPLVSTAANEYLHGYPSNEGQPSGGVVSDGLPQGLLGRPLAQLAAVPLSRNQTLLEPPNEGDANGDEGHPGEPARRHGVLLEADPTEVVDEQ